MRKHKASYIYRISDDTFTIYRLSHYSREPMLAVAAGLAYNGRGNHSDDFLRKLKKYGIDHEDMRYEFLDNSKNEVCTSIYLTQTVSAEHCRLPKEQVPNRILEFGEHLLDSNMRKKERESERVISRVIKLLGDKVTNSDEAKEYLMKNHKHMILY